MNERPSPVGADPRIEAALQELEPLLVAAVARVCPRDLGIQPEDVAQETRLRLWRALESERGITDPASYVRRAAASAAIDAVRRLRARREEPLVFRFQADDRSGEIEPAAPVSTSSPEALASHRELAEKVFRVVSGIPQPRRRPVQLYLRGFTSHEIAALLGCTEPKARNLLYRGLRDVAHALRLMGIDYDAA